MDEDLTVTDKRKHLIIFWSRMVGRLLTGTAAPIGVFAWKFGLFDVTSYTTTTDELGNVTSVSVALNGWGILSCFLIGLTMINIIKEVLSAYQGYSLPKQCLKGLNSRIIPLVIAFFICYFLKGVIDQILFCLATFIFTQIAAIPLNPLPSWRYNKTKQEDYDDAYSLIVKALKRTKKEE